jgi:hypothetical protein
MAAPVTVRACGFYAVTRAGTPAGEAVLRMKSATKGTLAFDGKEWKLTGSAQKKSFKGTRPGSVVQLNLVNRNQLKGNADGDALLLDRNVLRPIPAPEKSQSDSGPEGSIKTIINATPDYQAEVGDTTTFWYSFGNLLYRGRLDGSARVICIASDPGPTECLPFVRRALVGDSGQKAQGFLSKLGLTTSYVLVNAFAVALHPSKSTKGLDVLKNNTKIMAARHGMYSALLNGGTQAIIAFGGNAEEAYRLWKASNAAVATIPFFKVAHPAAVDRDGSGNDTALKGWAKAIPKLRAIVTPDPDGDPGQPNYGSFFTEMDYTRIPRRDLPKVAPAYTGDDSWGRAANPRHGNCCKRPSPDDGQSLILQPPQGQGILLRYKYNKGKLVGAKGKNGKKVSVDAFGIPT